jgi:hypothetical protein
VKTTQVDSALPPVLILLATGLSGLLKTLYLQTTRVKRSGEKNPLGYILAQPL